MKRFTFIIGLFIYLFVFVSGYSLAEEEDGNVFYLGEVVVTGKSEVITQVATVETIDKNMIELTNSDDISSALDNMPGVAVSTGMRNEAYINVRGFSQRYVPVFYDGIPWYVPYDGYVDASEISTGTVSKISLTKGAASSIYGANTMGGVINIISQKPQEAFEGSYRLVLDTNGYSGNLNLGSRLEKFYFMAGISGLDSDGFEMSDDFVPMPAVDAWYENGGERDNSDIKSLTKSIKVGFTPAEGHEYAIGYHKIDSEKGMPTNVYSTETQRYWRASDWDKTTYYFIGDSKLGENFALKTRIYHDEYYNVFDAYDDYTYTTQNFGSSWHSTYDDYTNGASFVLRTDIISKNVLNFSYHIKNDVHRSQGDYGDDWERYKGRTSSYGIEDAVYLTENLNFVLGTNVDVQEATYNNGNPTRDDDNSWNYVAGMTYYDNSSRKYYLSLAKKSRFPTLKELYSSYMDTGVPNPDLEKEQAMNYEVGFQSPLPLDSNIALALFYSDVEDLIVSTRVRIDGVRYDKNDNIGESRFQGFELGFNTEIISGNSINLTYTYLDAKNRSVDRTSDYLEEAPKHQLSLTDNYKITDAFSIFAKLGYEKGQYQEVFSAELDDYTWTELDSWWTVDIKGVYKFSDYLQVEAGAKNLFDENYETTYGFPRAGRTLFLGIKGTF